MDWSHEQLGDMSDKVVVVTGGNSGLGLECVKVLSAHGAQVVMASRNAGKADAAIEEISAIQPDARITHMLLDLADLGVVREFCDEFVNRFEKLDVLMNNAGVMAIPRSQTADGFEQQFGSNHLGHFALTGRLLPMLLATPRSRVVSVTSMAANGGKIRFDDLMGTRRYRRWTAYGQSKLANMLFGRELQRRLAESGSHTISVLAHPGFSTTNLSKGPLQGASPVMALVEKTVQLICQPPADGALPQLYAATEAGVRGDDYFGPSGIAQIQGTPRRVSYPKSGRDLEAAERLWNTSAELTGVDFASLCC